MSSQIFLNSGRLRPHWPVRHGWTLLGLALLVPGLPGCGSRPFCSNSDPELQCAAGFTCVDDECVAVLLPDARVDEDGAGGADLPTPDQGPVPDQGLPREDGGGVPCLDEDGDGWCVAEPAGCDHTARPCRADPATSPDCQDQDREIFPGQSELCDGLDQDCDGETDEEFVWHSPAGDLALGQPCGEADQACGSGLVVCTPDRYNACCSADPDCRPPSAEVCDGVDNDCDGETDEEVDPVAEGADRCPPHGVCLGRATVCRDGAWQCDRPPSYREREDDTQCDGLDNDCDGQLDEAFPDRGAPCTAGVGTCRRGGELICAADGRGLVCDAAPAPAGQEICDSLDNDCDGQTDEELGSTSCGLGQCRREVDLCRGGLAVECTPGDPAEEQCNGLDDDCDGQTDEELGTTSCGVGGCARTVAACQDGQPQACTPGQPSQETCGNGLDDDCDGVIDQNPPCACDEGATQPCGGLPAGLDGIGRCRQGQQTCRGNSWGPCEGEVLPAPEVCNAVDDDCDGAVDGLSRDCFSGQADRRRVGECRDGVQHCVDGLWGECTGEVLPRPEVCNNLDDDCNGRIDGLEQECYEGPAGSEGRGECHGGRRVCQAGQWTGCEGQVVPVAEQCNGLDDDCDGRSDDFTRSCYSGNPQTLGVGLCRAGTQSCRAGAWSACSNEVLPVAELCDNRDNDCNGVVDGLTRACYTGPGATRGVGACRDGTNTCNAGVWSGACAGEVLPAAADVCNGLDDDCDGLRDETAQDRGMVYASYRITEPRPTIVYYCIDPYEASASGATGASQGTRAGAAFSLPDVLPWTDLSAVTAEQACTAAGKRLCQQAEYIVACVGRTPESLDPVYPYGLEYDPDACNGRDDAIDGLAPTGRFRGCRSPAGTSDQSGNASEWVVRLEDRAPGAAGGSHRSSEAGLSCLTAPTIRLVDNTIGFRCCKDRGD